MGLRILVLTWLASRVVGCFAQDASQTLRLLHLKNAQLELEQTRTEFERATSLADQGLMSEQEAMVARTRHMKAQVAYQEALITFLQSEPRVSVVRAEKVQDPDGQKRVDVTLRYACRELDELRRLQLDTEAIFPLDLLDDVKDVYVSLRIDDRIASDPYEVRVAALARESTDTVSFRLLKDVESLDVHVSYAGKNESTPVFLQKGKSVRPVTLTSAQFSQEADLGEAAIFDLNLEKFGGDQAVFRLVAVNLPEAIHAEFVDTETGARLSQVRFPEGVTTLGLSARVDLPSIWDDAIPLDQPLSFFVLVLDRDFAETWAEVNATRDGLWREHDVQELGVSYVRLELIPRGVGRVELRAANLYYEAEVGDEVSLEVMVRNGGTRVLNQVQLVSQLPLHWQVQLDPDRIGTLHRQGEMPISVRLIPPPDCPAGEFEVRLRAESDARGRHLESEDLGVRIRMKKRQNVWGSGLAFALILAAMVALVTYAIRLVKR